MTYFIAGLLATLTAPVFLLLLACIIIFEKLANTQKGYMKNTIRFILLLNFIFIIASYMYIPLGALDQFRVDIFFDYIFYEEIILAAFLIWFLIKLTLKKTIPFFDSFFYWLGIPLFVIKLFFTSFSSIGPLIGQTIVDGFNSINPPSLPLNILFFSLALSFVFGLVLFLSKYFYKKFGREKWWEVLQVITAVLMLVATGMNIFGYLNL